ncbi:hypothetical protein Tco_1367029, partial [Tanacetum coccineum]
ENSLVNKHGEKLVGLLHDTGSNQIVVLCHGFQSSKGITINTNAWSDAGHSVNQIYDILYMMGRDDVAVGVGGEGGILEDGTIQPNVGGYIPIIDQ